MADYGGYPKQPRAQLSYYPYDSQHAVSSDSMNPSGGPPLPTYASLAQDDAHSPYPRGAMPSAENHPQSLDYQYSSSHQGSRWNPRNWSKRTWIVAVVVAIVALIAIIVGAVEGTKSNAYPDYTPLNYSLTDTYSGANFFDNFQYWDTYDPAQGFVHYSNPTQSVQMNLTYASADSAVLRVDNTEANATTGRHSARVSSIKTYESGLFIFDVLHTPYGCATWSAVWLVDQYNWPDNGEIDVIEAVNKATSGNQMTLHTTKGCTTNVKRKETGSRLQTNCYNGTDDNQGCGVSGPVSTYGSALNTLGGGVYALEVRSAGIRIWFFPRASVPADITAGTAPTPQTWGEALADFPSTDCDIGAHFRNMSIVANIDVCGTWAGSTSAYSTKGGCPGTCTDYAAQNPAAFDQAYWEFASFKVYSAA